MVTPCQDHASTSHGPFVHNMQVWVILPSSQDHASTSHGPCVHNIGFIRVIWHSLLELPISITPTSSKPPTLPPTSKSARQIICRCTHVHTLYPFLCCSPFLPQCSHCQLLSSSPTMQSTNSCSNPGLSAQVCCPKRLLGGCACDFTGFFCGMYILFWATAPSYKVAKCNLMQG